MKLLDTSPSGFVIAANAFVFGVVGIEIWMLVSGSIVAMGFVLGLIAVLVAVLVHGMSALMGSEEYTAGHEIVAAGAAEADTEEARAAERRPATTGRPALS